ncbi:MAG: hypothetical protein GWP18_06670, partial [Proteobacteria bacterium]|nr:hypothetical protein [Pseudomonadota bacterium]
MNILRLVGHMGHRDQNAIDELRAYARDIENATSRGGLQRVGRPDQDDARFKKPTSGAPHQLAVAALVACVVLIGSIVALVGAPENSKSAGGAIVADGSSHVAGSSFLTYGNSPAQAMRVFSSIGMPRVVAALSAASEAGVFSDPATTSALADVRMIIDEYIRSGRTIDESSEPLASAVDDLEDAVRPPGLDPDVDPPGQGGTPPGQDPEFTPPGQDPEFTPPGQDPEFTPPGQDP